MGIISQEGEAYEDTIIDENIQGGKYYMGSYTLQWSIDLSSNEITLNLANRPDLGTKVISKKNLEAEFHVDSPRHKILHAKISGNFDSNQLLLNGYVKFVMLNHKWKRVRYENIILTSW